GAVALGARRLEPGLEIGGVVGPLNPPPAIVRGDPFRKVIENERTEYRAAAGVELRPPIPGQRRQQRIAAEPLEIITEPLIVRLAFEQQLDRPAQLLLVHVPAAQATMQTTIQPTIRRALSARLWQN